MKIIVSVLIFFLSSCTSVKYSEQSKKFSNPLLEAGADPWSIYKDGYYYYTQTSSNLAIWKTKNLKDLRSAEKKVVWAPPSESMHSKQLWAPEIHFLKGKWYMYFAASDGNNYNHRMYVIENPSENPLEGAWTFKGKVADASDKWAIDGSVFEHQNKLYMIWSGWEGNKNGQQDIYIAEMENPWTIKGERHKIASPFFAWEKNGDLKGNDVPHVNVNEGPQILKKGNKIFMIYSASGCWTDFYALGMLTASAQSNLLNPASWIKSPEPVFSQSVTNGVYAPGHNSFFKSPDGREDWILYHANSKPGQGCGHHRSPRAQRFSWKADGTPYFGVPLKALNKSDTLSATRKLIRTRK
ncbi:MAG TPA: glycoside hydrolase family 43 protein [Sphingobacteriaceae bacterium]|nr:glycoside hydrolase family 43 protein [Sphingobacteriaceae bacterium]